MWWRSVGWVGVGGAWPRVSAVVQVVGNGREGRPEAGRTECVGMSSVCVRDSRGLRWPRPAVELCPGDDESPGRDRGRGAHALVLRDAP